MNHAINKMLAIAGAVALAVGCECIFKCDKYEKPIDVGNRLSMNFISIAPFFPNDMEYTIRESRHMAEASGIKKNAYSMTMQPDGTDVYAKPKLCAEAFGKLREALKDDDIIPGILIQSTVGHGWAGAVTCERDWAEIINIKGITLHRMCMLDPNFREYTRTMIKMLAEKKPAFFLIDDDLRAINNSDNGPECFCPLHLAEFNKRSGRQYTQEQLIAKIKTGAWNDPDVVVFEQLRKATVLGFAKLIRDAIDEVDPSIPCGYCSGGGEYLLAGDIARTLAGKGESFLRINNAMYLEGDPKDFYNSIYQTAFKVAAAGKLDSILDESDTCPHNRWSKSAVTMHNHITGGILNGVSGGKLWISDLRNKCDYDVSEFRKIVKEHVGFYDTLLNEVDAVKWCGPNAVLRNAAFQFNPGTALKPLVYNNWNATIIDRFGLPSQYGAIRPDTINTLTADTVDSLDDTDIATVLSGRALVDGHAALKLADRGFARHLGCKPERKPFKTGGEHLLGSKWHCRFQNTGLPFLGDLAKGAVPLSEITVPPYRYAPTSNYVMPGAVYYENELGGKVITTSLSVNSTVYNYQGHDRKEWMIALLEKLDPGAMPLYMTALQNVYFKCGIRPDGNLLAAAYNLSYDELPDISLRGNVAVAQVEMLTGDGKWEKVCFEQNGRDIVVNKSLKCQEIAIFRITKRH